jgi:hypothetical protein
MPGVEHVLSASNVGIGNYCCECSLAVLTSLRVLLSWRLCAITTADRSPCFIAFLLDRPFPAGVFGPVDCFHGFTLWADARKELIPSGVSR